jgi:predicted aspartyl protease
MMRFGAYYLLWFFSISFFISNQATAPRESRDVMIAVDEIPESAEDDYFMPAEAQTGTIPFVRAGNLILLQASVDGVSGNFIFDTGAPGLVLNLTYFRNYKSSQRADSEGGGITGHTHGASPTMVEALNLGGFTYKRVHAHRVNLGHIENTRGVKIMGLLGAGLFKRYEVLIDYENEQIHLNRVALQNKNHYRSVYYSESKYYHILSFRLVGRKMVTPLLIGGQKLNFVLDTGAETNILDSRLKKIVFNEVVMERKIDLIGSGSKIVEAWYGRVKSGSIGTMQLENMEVLVTSLQHMSAAFGVDIDGMLGIGFLSKQKVVINFLQNELYVWK